jgi:hypothetical protein
VHHNLEAGLLRVSLVGIGDADTVRTVFVDQRDLHVLGVHAELRLGVLGEEPGECFAILVGVNLTAEHIGQVLALEHGGGHRSRDPENLFLLLHLGSHRHRVRAGINADNDVELLLVDQALDFVDARFDLALRVGVDRSDFIFAVDTALFVDEVDRDLRADRRRHRATSRERARVIEDGADTDRLGLRLGETPVEAQCGSSRRSAFQHCSASSLHRVSSRIAKLWRLIFIVLLLVVFGQCTGMSTSGLTGAAGFVALSPCSHNDAA